MFKIKLTRKYFPVDKKESSFNNIIRWNGSKGNMAEHNYTADSIKSLDWKEHIRLRPGMYIGKLGDGSS